MSHQSSSDKPLLSPVIVALDFPDAPSALSFVQRLDPRQCRVKVGKELYTRCGPSILEALHHLDFDVFLDLKFHDIPNTTSAAVGVAADLGVWMVNVHASGGRRMMEACVETLSKHSQKPKLIGVTVLTSMEQKDLSDIGLEVTPQSQVKRLALLAKESGLDGIVCSSQEVTMLKQICGSDFELVTPGIRPASAAPDDQRRIMTPKAAVQAGSDYLVIGRPITRAADPSEALEGILAELNVG